MPERVQRPKVNRKREQAQAEQAWAESLPSPHTSSEKTKAELDGLLDEIDEVLEENAAEFVAEYRQKGGE